jgi:hypothetical protein
MSNKSASSGSSQLPQLQLNEEHCKSSKHASPVSPLPQATTTGSHHNQRRG